MKKSALVMGMVAMGLVSAGERAQAWGDLGHEIVGGVAEQMIEPQTKDFVRGILGIEPLAVAAVFPDHARDDDRFGHTDYNPATRDANNHDFSDYHFCEIPAGYTYDTKPNKSAKDCYGAITGAIALLKDTTGLVSKPEKIIAIRYLVHVMGDIAQPLHVGNGYDRGGNACQINLQEDPAQPAKSMNLHSFWDDTMVAALGSTYRHRARYMGDFLSNFKTSRPEMLTAAAKAQASQGDLKSWLADSTTLRDSGIYPDAAGSMTNVVKGEEYKSRPYCQWFDAQTGKLGAGSKVDKTQIPLIGLDYEKKFTPVVETQLLKGGLRLAAVLDQIAVAATQGAHPAKPMSADQQEKILVHLQDTFRAHAGK